MSEPETPLHAPPNQHVDLSKIKELDENDIMDLDLVCRTTDDPNISNNGSHTSKREFVEDDTVYDNVDDFRPRVNMRSPFSSNGTARQSQPSLPTSTRPRNRLSLSQQSRFISYMDERLMNVQRKFVQSRGLHAENGYTGLEPLLEDLKSIVDFIWYSIDGSTPNTEVLLTETLSEFSADQFAGFKSTYFGQISYLMRVADDVMDYTEKMDLNESNLEKRNNILSKLFKLLFILDHIFARLLDGTIPGETKMNNTDAVRMRAIAERTRIRLPLYLSRQNVHGYHYEVSKVYEESLERFCN